MPLQTEGQISLNDIHIEAGGTSGTIATINDADIRALISKSSGVQMAFNEWYGASASSSITVTAGTTSWYGAIYPNWTAWSDYSPTSYWDGDFIGFANANEDGWVAEMISAPTYFYERGGTGAIGSISSTTFTDNGSNTRTIAQVGKLHETTDVGIMVPDQDTLILCLLGTSIPNTNTTFNNMVVNGVSISRSSANFYYASINGCTVWRWLNITNTSVFDTTGSHTLEFN